MIVTQGNGQDRGKHRRAIRKTILTGASRLALIGLAGATFAPTAWADDADAKPRADDIIVTGSVPEDYVVAGQSSSTRLDLSLRETPQAVTVITRAQIEDFGLNTVDDLLRRATGVNVDSAETDRTYYNARGFDIVNFQFDGIGQPLSYGLQNGQIDTSLFERVDIVRGATGLLSQTGNPSAAINFIRKRPTKELGGDASLSYGSYDEVRGSVDVNTPLTEDGSIRTRFVGSYENADSYLDFYHTSRLTLYGVAAADLGPDTVATVGYSWQESDPRGVSWGALPFTYADGTPATYPRSTNSAQPWTRWYSLDRNLFGDITLDFGDGWTGKVSVLRRARNQDSKLFYVYYGEDGELAAYPGAYLDKLRETTIDANVTGKVRIAGREHDVVLGVNYGVSQLVEQESVDADAIGAALPGNSAFEGTFPYPNWGPYTPQADFTTKIASAYGLVRLSLADPLKLMLGGNVTNARRDGTSYDTPYSFDKTKFLPFAGLTLDLTGNITAYASYATIFSPQVYLTADHSIIAPLQGKTYEAGVKGEWNGGKLTAAVAVFRTKEDNVAESIGFDPTLGQTLYDGVDAKSQGVEVDVAGEVLPGFQVSGGYAYVDIEDTDGNNARAFIPRHTAHLNATYTPRFLEALRLGASARYQSRIHNDYTEQDGYAIVDLMARYQVTRNVSVAVNLDNLTNVKYWTSLQWDQAYYGAPRTVRGTLGVSF
ncbi:outer membrane receptor for ferric coprogen and ferric-rhodotorulic acid [Novosphingobium sp. PhB165]|uniref:TonB-dependent siderophore receptor n=1 Tax=Novosphingobium sp. PhB165 TaxID=2485105 RepID=UPI0010EE9B79|nr:TonB-dependent siderophore receptor [Novosphingobium sp. PhB165]TCM21747.1 outer membrane receptor for ferric coprogen and ferric-rhodotorulic acid [Novosphingobium sp. PhB165]